MRDSKLPNIPIGTVFKISFDVDKYGKITNLQTWSHYQALVAMNSTGMGGTIQHITLRFSNF